MSKDDSPVALVLPAWAERVRQLYLAGEANVFIVHGNVQDYVFGGTKLMPMLEFIDAWMATTKKAVFEWSVYKGLTKRGAPDPAVPASEALGGMLATLKKLDTVMRRTETSSCLVVPHANALIPSGDAQYRSAEERMLLSALLDWSMDDKIAAGNNLVFLFAESTMDLPAELLANPRIATVQIALPDEAARLAVIRTASSRTDDGVARIAQQTAGLKLVQIHALFGKDKGMSVEDREKLVRGILVSQGASGPSLEERVKKMGDITGGMTPDEIAELLGSERSHRDADEEMLAALMVRKRALIEKECSGLIEFMDTRHGLDAVGGNDNIKHELMAIAKVIKSGDRRLAPMGLLAVGAMGSGKTFVIRAFLKEAGLTGLTLKNFRSKWVGSTESNLERVLATVRAMGPVALVIDESDRSFGNGESGGDSDGGTSSRIIARLKEFMSDTDNRGQVLFIMMTNRPDKLDTDIKRPGRLDRKIPFFYADNVADLRSIATVLCKRYGVSADPLVDDALVEGMRDYSNADIEALVGLYANNVQQSPEGDVAQLFKQALADFIPPREEGMITYMNLLAVKEASRKSLVPERYHHLYEGDALSTALAQAKRSLY